MQHSGTPTLEFSFPSVKNNYYIQLGLFMNLRRIEEGRPDTNSGHQLLPLCKKDQTLGHCLSFISSVVKSFAMGKYKLTNIGREKAHCY